MDRKDFVCDYCQQQLEFVYAYSNYHEWICDICNKTFDKTEKSWHCSCETVEPFDVCNVCYEKKDCRQKRDYRCDFCRGDLSLEKAYKDSEVFNSWFCNICKEKFSPQEESWNCYCTVEGFDICVPCYKKRDGRGIYWGFDIMERYDKLRAMNPEEREKNNEEITEQAKKRQKELEEEEILKRAKQEQQLIDPIHQITINFFDKGAESQQSQETQKSKQQKEEENQTSSDDKSNLDEEYKEIYKLIKENFEKTKPQMEQMSKEDLIQSIYRLQLQLGQTIIEKKHTEKELKEYKHNFDPRYVVDYPIQSRYQPNVWGLYTGYMVGKSREGKGLTVWNDGIEQMGTYKNDDLIGYGELRSIKAENYKGEWANGEFHGHGAIQYPNGDIYVGDFQKHRKHGQGKFIKKVNENDKIVYQGTFKNGMLHGYFDVIKNGTKKRNCYFQNNKLEREGIEDNRD